MNRIRVREGLNITLPREIRKSFPITEGGDLIIEVENGRRIILTPSPSGNLVDKTAGILKSGAEEGVVYENRLRRQTEKRLKSEGIK